MTVNFELLKVNKMTSLARNIKFGQQVNPIQRVLLAMPLQEVLTSLPPIHITLTNLYLQSQGLLLLNFGSKNNLIEVHTALLLHWG